MSIPSVRLIGGFEFYPRFLVNYGFTTGERLLLLGLGRVLRLTLGLSGASAAEARWLSCDRGGPPQGSRYAHFRAAMLASSRQVISLMFS